MTNLKEQVEQYVARGQELQDLEEQVMKEIREAFDREIPGLNAKLPTGYIIVKYEIHPPEGLHSRKAGDIRHKKIRLLIPVRNADAISFSEILRLNHLLAEDYARFEEQTGVILQGFTETHQPELQMTYPYSDKVY